MARAAAAAPTYRTKQAMVHAALRARILDGSLPPGARLVIDDIASELAVSPIPVREALHLLQSERLIELRPHLGAVVATLSADSISELFALMECLELAALRLAVGRVRPAHLAELERLAGLMHARRLADARWAELNHAFHEHICAIAEAPRVREMTARVFLDWERLRRHAYRHCPPPDPEHAHRQHLAMIAALARGDLPALEALTREHNRQALAGYLATGAGVGSGRGRNETAIPIPGTPA